MDTNLLRSWLWMPPGDWPPEPRSFFGDNPDGVQERALALMEKLRPHQLRHPDLVTEGMNRLAQALMALEAPVKSTPPTKVEDFVFAAEEMPPPAAIPLVLEAEIVEVTPFRTEPPPPRPKKRKAKRKPSEPPVPVPALPPSRLIEIANRRQAYRKLAHIRKLTNSWTKLGPFHGVPSQELLTSADIFRYLEATFESRRHLPKRSDWPVVRGTLSLAVLQHGATLSLFRDLRKSQRDQLAADWATALAQLRAEELSLRQSLRASKPRATWRRRLRATKCWFRSNPEWMLLAIFAIGAIAVAFRLLRRNAVS